MELILKQDVENLGFKDDIVTVKNGYGRNFLIPTGRAILATTSAKKVLAENLKQQAYKEAKLIVKQAIKEDTHYGEFPKDFFVNFRKEGVLHPDHPNSPVERMVVGGRGTFIVPEKQKL